MSLEIVLTRTKVPGTDRRLGNDDTLPLTHGDFELIMDGAPIRSRQADGSCWLWHPSGAPWLAASFRSGKSAGDGQIVFSLSYGNNQFLKMMADGIDLALRMSRHLGARVFEDASYQELTRDNAESLLSPHGKFVTEQAALWKRTVAALEEKNQAPLEYPIGRYDAVNDYFILFLEPVSTVDIPNLGRKLNLCIASDSLAADRFALQDPGSGSILARVLLRPNDNALQIKPFYWMEPFNRVAAETLNLASVLQNELGGPLFLQDKPITPEFRVEIADHSQGLGIEFFHWLEERKSLPS